VTICGTPPQANNRETLLRLIAASLPLPQERVIQYGSEALDSIERLGLITGNQQQAASLLEHFGSFRQLDRASVQELLPFLSRANALRIVSSLRLAAVEGIPQGAPVWPLLVNLCRLLG